MRTHQASEERSDVCFFGGRRRLARERLSQGCGGSRNFYTCGKRFELAEIQALNALRK